MDRFKAIVATMAANQRTRTVVKATRFQPFITIARQAGAGGHTVMEKLVARLRELDPSDPPWAGFDREIVELAAQDDKVFRPLVESLEVETRTWLDDFLASLITQRNATEFAALRRTFEAIEAVVQHGRAVVVGRGGALLTRKRPGGTHVYLVAPEEDRIAHMAELRGISESEAATEVRRIDSNREKFYRRYWPGVAFSPELFTLTINTALSTDEAIVESIIPLVQGIQGRPIHQTRVGVGR